MQHSFEVPIYQTISFWICVGLFVYFTGNFFYILLVENSKNADEVVKNELKIIYCVVTITKNLILGLAMFNSKVEETPKEKSLEIPTNLNLDSYTPNIHLN